MDSASNSSPSGDFSDLLDELASIARVRRHVEREFRLIKLSEEAKQRYGIEAAAYLDLYRKYYAAASQAVRIRTIGSLIYRVLVGTAALGAALSALNLYGFLSDQRGKAIADSWKTIDTYSDKPYDGGRRAAAESLLSYGQVLYHANFNRAPFVYLKAHPTCKVLGLPLGVFGTAAGWRSNDSGLLPKDCIRAELQNAEFRGAKLYGSNFSHANLYQADFYAFTSPGKDPITTQAHSVDFSHANLRASNFANTDLSNSNFKNANLAGATFSHANLYQADFSAFTSPDKDPKPTQAQSVDFSHANLRASNFANTDLSNSNFKNANLAGATLANSNLSKANFRGADLRGADLRGADFRGAELCNTFVNAKTLGKELLSEIPSSCHGKAVIVEH